MSPEFPSTNPELPEAVRGWLHGLGYLIAVSLIAQTPEKHRAGVVEKLREVEGVVVGPPQQVAEKLGLGEAPKSEYVESLSEALAYVRHVLEKEGEEAGGDE